MPSNSVINLTSTSTTITNVNLNATNTNLLSSTSLNQANNNMNDMRMITLGSASSSLSSSSSSYSLPKSGSPQSGAANEKDYEKENDSGIEKEENNTIFIRIAITDQNLQKVLKFSQDETVWNAKQRVLATLAKEVKDGLNYGFYLPPFQGRAGKFLDDCRQLKEYSLTGPIAQLEVTFNLFI